MQVTQIDKCSFGVKNTYLNQAEKALTKSDKRKFLSYHYEAKARCHYLRHLAAARKLTQEPNIKSFKDVMDLTKAYFKMAYDKIASVNDIAKAYKMFPLRFEN